MKIPLHKPLWGKKAEAAVIKAMRTGAGVADGRYSQEMREKLKRLTAARYALPVTSCTHAMEAIMMGLGVKTGDEVIVPSFTLASTATAVMIHGARPVFADIDPVTYSLDPADVEKKLTKRTVGILTVHYAGMAGTNFDGLRRLAKSNGLWLAEDAAHCIGSWYKDRHLGTFGVAGAFSFHGTKNIACGEGGAIITNTRVLADKMEVIRAIGTDRQAFLQGKVSLYQWVGVGSSYLLSDILASLVNIQIDQIDRINKDREQIASEYTKALNPFASNIQLPIVPKGMSNPNWHIYAIKFRTPKQAVNFVSKMHAKHISATTHYVPLHASPMGRTLTGSKFRLPVTEDVAKTLVRMPIYAGMTERELDYVINTAQNILKNI